MGIAFEIVEYKTIDNFVKALEWMGVSEGARKEAYYFVRDSVKGRISLDGLTVKEFENLDGALDKYKITRDELLEYKNESDGNLVDTLDRYLQNEIYMHDIVNLTNHNDGRLVVIAIDGYFNDENYNENDPIEW
jgi:hypothetical protein